MHFHAARSTPASFGTQARDKEAKATAWQAAMMASSRGSYRAYSAPARNPPAIGGRTLDPR